MNIFSKMIRKIIGYKADYQNCLELRLLVNDGFTFMFRIA